MVEKLNNNSEGGYKIQTSRCLFFKEDRFQGWKGRRVDSQGDPARETQR
jgi:hypothetical protein